MKCSKQAVDLAVEKRYSRIDVLLKGYGIPTTLGTHTQPLQGMEWALPYAATNRGLFLSGPSGVGKSVAAVLIARRWLELWATEAVVNLSAGRDNTKEPATEWRFVSCAALVMKLQDLWRSDEDSAFKHLQGVATVPHLILDDIGTEKASDYVKQAMYYLINEREAWGRQTIITSNYDLVRIEAQYDSRIGSRIMGMCDARDLRGRDRRAPTP